MPDKDSKICIFTYFLRTILYPIAAINIDINGESKLKKQYGRYSNVATLSTVA